MYNLSKNYLQLYQLVIQGIAVAAFITGKRGNHNDLCKIERKSHDRIRFSVRGLCYDEIYPEDDISEQALFTKACEDLQLEWIDPAITPQTTKIVCLCGSTRFKDAFIEANRIESTQGHIVLSVAMFGHLEGLDMSGDEKQVFDELHLRKIDLCHEVLVLNVDGYIGESTQKEIDYAKRIGRPIRYLETLTQQGECAHV